MDSAQIADPREICCPACQARDTLSALATASDMAKLIRMIVPCLTARRSRQGGHLAGLSMAPPRADPSTGRTVGDCGRPVSAPPLPIPSAASIPRPAASSTAIGRGQSHAVAGLRPLPRGAVWEAISARSRDGRSANPGCGGAWWHREDGAENGTAGAAGSLARPAWG
jgi:hypothetical protein